MSDRPSDGMNLDELREEFDWISEFQSRMAERIRGDANVHNLVDYVGKLEAENAELRELVRDAIRATWACDSDECVHGAECGEGIDYPRVGDCVIGRRARELGIEVDA